MQTSPLAPRPIRPALIHAVARSDEGHGFEAMHRPIRQEAARRDQEAAKAKALDEPLADWQVFALLSGTAGGMLSLGLAALYGLSLLLP